MACHGEKRERWKEDGRQTHWRSVRTFTCVDHSLKVVDQVAHRVPWHGLASEWSVPSAVVDLASERRRLDEGAR